VIAQKNIFKLSKSTRIDFRTIRRLFLLFETKKENTALLGCLYMKENYAMINCISVF